MSAFAVAPPDLGAQASRRPAVWAALVAAFAILLGRGGPFATSLRGRPSSSATAKSGEPDGAAKRSRDQRPELPRASTRLPKSAFDLPTGPKGDQITVLTVEEEAVGRL